MVKMILPKGSDSQLYKIQSHADRGEYKRAFEELLQYLAYPENIWSLNRELSKLKSELEDLKTRIEDLEAGD